MDSEPEPEPDTNRILIQIALLVFLTAVNAFFAAAEMAMVSVNKNKLKRISESGNKNAKLVLKLLEEPTKFLSTIQVAITLAGFFSSASAATGFSEPLTAWLSSIGVPFGKQISFIGVTVILSYFTLVFGELVPKRLAQQKAETFSLFAVKPINLISNIAAPFIKLLSLSTNGVMKLFGSKMEASDDMLSREEIQSLIEEGQVQGIFKENEREMINSIIELDDTLAKEIMTPRVGVFAINILEPQDEFMDELLETKYSRIPVYEDDIDNIIGILYYKDFIREIIKKGHEDVDIRSLLIKPYLVPDSKNIYELFKELQQSKNHIAVLIDEYGGFSGIVTMEDLVEEVMGDIDDEYDTSLPKIKKIDNTTYIIDGMLTIDELNDCLDLDISSDNYDTVSGLLIDYIGEIPSEGDERTIEIDDLVFKIESVKKKRIERIKLYISNRETIDDEVII